mgnify:CR=1 FL=1
MTNTISEILQRIAYELAGKMPMRDVERLFANVGHDIETGGELRTEQREQGWKSGAVTWCREISDVLLQRARLESSPPPLFAQLSEAFAALQRAGVQVPTGDLESKVIWLSATAAMFEGLKPAIELGAPPSEPVLTASHANVAIVQNPEASSVSVIVKAGAERVVVAIMGENLDISVNSD